MLPRLSIINWAYQYICKRDKIRSELEGFSLFYDGGSYNRQIYCLYEWYTFK